MKAEMKHQLVKDVMVAAIAWIVVTIVMASMSGSGFFGGLFLGFFCAGIPFGWRWLSNIFVAVSLQSVAIKAFLSILVGWIALPVVIIRDIINYVEAA